MKDFIICLSHFCEIHGPTSIICTQSFDSENPAPDFSSSSSSSDTNSNTTTCLSCQISLPDPSTNKIIRTTNDHKTYISQQYPSSQPRYKVLRQIVMKCLSVETTYDDFKPIMFGDSALGFAILMSFKIKDNTARGSERKYALIVLSEDETQLLKSWSLINVSLTTLIKLIKAKISELELKQLNDLNNNERFYRRILPKPKNLTELLDDEKLFIKIHLWGSNLLNHLKNN